MSNRIKQMRTSLYERLIQLGTLGSWEHITTQIGMFSYTGLTGQYSIEHLINHYYIYMLRSGRINMCGLNKFNLDYVASAIYETVLLFPEKKKQCIC
ncbi:Aspartate aminotransferase, cytoplasmic [Anthophora retusa]